MEKTEEEGTQKLDFFDNSLFREFREFGNNITLTKCEVNRYYLIT